MTTPFRLHGIPQEFLGHAKRAVILERIGLAPQSLARGIVEDMAALSARGPGSRELVSAAASGQPSAAPRRPGCAKLVLECRARRPPPTVHRRRCSRAGEHVDGAVVRPWTSKPSAAKVSLPSHW